MNSTQPHRPKVAMHNGDCLEIMRTMPDGAFGLSCFSPPYNLSNGFHWTLWYNTPTQPYENKRITEDISVNLTGCNEEDEETDFGWYVTLLTLLCF